ncbi:MAG: hypothetical protein ACHQ50_00665 [Fimbriimonadales bacterium]
MAALVIGGKGDFDYRAFDGWDETLDPIWVSWRVTDLKISMSAGQAEAAFNETYTSLPKGSGGGKGDSLTLKIVDNRWRIVPIENKYEEMLGTWAYTVAHPEEMSARVHHWSDPTWNRSPIGRRLGLDRTKMLDEVFARGEAINSRANDEPPGYTGYWNMTDTPHTTVLWPAGRADVVFFFLTYDGGPEPANAANYLTCWRRVGGKAKRIWQYRLSRVRRTPPPEGGSLAKWLRAQGCALPKGASRDAVQSANSVQLLAAYHEQGPTSSYLCWTVTEDGREAPKDGPDLQPTGQSGYQARKQGFFITRDESDWIRRHAGR